MLIEFFCWVVVLIVFIIFTIFYLNSSYKMSRTIESVKQDIMLPSSLNKIEIMNEIIDGKEDILNQSFHQGKKNNSNQTLKSRITNGLQPIGGFNIYKNIFKDVDGNFSISGNDTISFKFKNSKVFNKDDDTILDIDGINKIIKINGDMYINKKNIGRELDNVRQYSEDNITEAMNKIQSQILNKM